MTALERIQYNRLMRRWQTATNEEREQIEKQMAALKEKSSADKPTEEKDGKDTKKTSAPKNLPKPGGQKNSVIPPLQNLPYGPFCSYADIMPMVEVDIGDEKKWMTYETYRTKNPDANIFDILPNAIAIMYLNQNEYQELEDDKSQDLTPQEMMNKCTHRLPSDFDPVELAIIDGLLFCEAQNDMRIEKLGYKGETMYDFENLYADFYDCIIYNVLHRGMTLEDARVFAETGKMPEKPAKQNPPKQKSESDQQPQHTQQPKGKAQPPKKQVKKPVPAKNGKRPQARATL